MKKKEKIRHHHHHHHHHYHDKDDKKDKEKNDKYKNDKNKYSHELIKSKALSRKKIPNLLIKEVAKNIKKILYYSKYRGYYSNFLATSLHSKII